MPQAGYEAFDSRLSSLGQGREVTVESVKLCRADGATTNLSEMALFGSREVRLAAVEALGDFNDSICQETLAVVYIEGWLWNQDDDVIEAAGMASDRIYASASGRPSTLSAGTGPSSVSRPPTARCRLRPHRGLKTR